LASDSSRTLSIGDAPVSQPSIQLVIGLNVLRRKKAFSSQTDLILDLSLLQPEPGVQSTGFTGQ
jgi:hypothetical protein